MSTALRGVPQPSDRRIAVRVTPAAERAVRAGHPWIFDQAIREQSRDGAPGDLAVVFDRKRRFLAVGLYDSLSPIRVRVLQHNQPATINQGWLRERIKTAAERRIDLPAQDTTGYRLVHGENDGLPGLVVDRYSATFVVKLYSAAWIPHLANVLTALVELVAPERVVLRLSRALQANDACLHGLEDGLVLHGAPVDGPVLFLENGLIFEADVIYGQKTGFYLDQRENRARVERLASGRDVLNLFAYTGGFSVYAARGGARSVMSVDSSEPALEAARRNFQHNRHHPGVAAASHQTVVGDAFDVLTQFKREGRAFDVVVIDPPAFAKSQSEAPRALAAYKRLVYSGLGVLRPHGVLVMFSCSSRVDAAAFYEVVQRAWSACLPTRQAARQGRTLRELERTGHPVDHPVGFREGAYLKGLFALVVD